MNSRAFILALGVLTIVLGSTLAQRPDDATAAPKPKPESGRFAVATSGDMIVLVDTATGRSWFLKRTGESPTWVALGTPAGLQAPEVGSPRVPGAGGLRPDSSEDRLKRSFDMFDSNKDGKISRDEFPRFIPKEHFDDFDTNKDGFIDLAEFTKGMESLRGGGRR